jgi:hypothetical protein
MCFNQSHRRAGHIAERVECSHRLRYCRRKPDRPQPIHQSSIHWFRILETFSETARKRAASNANEQLEKCRGRFNAAQESEKTESARMRPTRERDQFYAWRLLIEARSGERGRELRANQSRGQ